MAAQTLSINPTLAGSSRLPHLAIDADRLRTVELLLLATAGVAATLATAFIELKLRLPGHSILRAVLPMAFGLAAAPRRMGGLVMGSSALGSACLLNVGGFAAIGPGAMTSLVLTGPLLDAALWRARAGWRLYLAFALAGLGSNVAALAARTGAKLIGIGKPTARPLFEWLPQAVATYAVCGLIAGLISAAIWFQLSSKQNPPGAESSP